VERRKASNSGSQLAGLRLYAEFSGKTAHSGEDLYGRRVPSARNVCRGGASIRLPAFDTDAFVTHGTVSARPFGTPDGSRRTTRP
jgi:hypothetical protein